MATLTIHDLDDGLKAQLEIRATRRNHSIEEEARGILASALKDEARRLGNLADRIRDLIEPLGGVELDTAWLRSERTGPPMTFEE